MRSHILQRPLARNVGLSTFVLALLVAMLACTSQPGVPSSTSPTPQKTPTPNQTTTTIQTPTTNLNTVATKGFATASPTASLIGKIGDRIASGDAAITVVNLTRTFQIGIFTASPGNTYLDVEVLIENTSRTDHLLYNPLYFKLKDLSGKQFSTILTALEPSLKTGDLEKGEKVRGHIAFEVTYDDPGLILSFEPNVYLSNYQVVRFDLSQRNTHPIQISTREPTAANGKLGERILVGGMALTVIKMSSAPTIGVYKPDQGKVFLDIEVTLGNTSQSNNLPCNPLYFKLKDADGYEYTTALVSLDPPLKSGDLAPGAAASGHIAFEVQKDAGGLVLTYEPVVLFKDYEEISVDLGE